LSLTALVFALAMILPQSSTDLAARRKTLTDLLAEHWEYTLAHNPEIASVLGDKRWNDKLSDLSQAAVAADLAKTKEFLDRFEAVDTTGFPEQEALNKSLMVRDLRQTLDDARFRGWLMPVTQIGGAHLAFGQLLSSLAFDSVKDYEDYIARLWQLPRVLGETMTNMRDGMTAGLMPPRFLLEKVVVQAQGMARTSPEASAFAHPLTEFPSSFSQRDRVRLRASGLAAIREAVLPAYARFAAFVKNDYAPRGRTDPGIWALPDGAERYAALARFHTTTRLTPDEIHEIGLQQVADLERQMMEIAEHLGFHDLKTLNAAIEKDPRLRPKSGDEILEIYRRYVDGMYPELPKLFGRLPRAKVIVEPVEKFREAEAAAANYNQGPPDGSRPGRIQVNTSDPQSRKTITMESTAYHEGVPGHHLQVSIGQELPGLPPFRQQASYTAFVEGWALYTERLGKEIGFYKDPYSDYGRLQDSMLRAIRLVVDTGVHAKRWSRDQMIQFFHDHSAEDEVDLQSETDRYIAWPGQALAYKIGQLKIQELRERSEKALGSRFDIKAFHDEVLGAGALPLDVLEARIDAWMAAQPTR
jgi:uncharacterized protein (DUF885 family)